MTNPWDQFGGPTNGAGFKSLEKPGDEIIGTLVRVGKASPFNDKDTGEPIVIPRLYFKGEDEEEFHYDVTLTWIRNALLRERPEIGAKLRLWRGGKKGQQVESGIEILSGGSAPLATVHNSGPKTQAKAATPPEADDLPPF